MSSCILVVDDHEIVFEGIRLLFYNEQESYRFEYVFDGAKLLELLAENEYDLIILDLNLPNTDTLNIFQEILEQYPKQKVLIYTMSSEDVYALKFMKLGAYGYLNKNSDSNELIKAIKSILSGVKYFTEDLKLKISRIFTDNEYSLNSLTTREMEILKLLVAGMGNKEICSKMNLHSSTVGTFKRHIFDKMNVSNIIELKTKAQQLNII